MEVAEGTMLRGGGDGRGWGSRLPAVVVYRTTVVFADTRARVIA